MRLLCVVCEFVVVGAVLLTAICSLTGCMSQKQMFSTIVSVMKEDAASSFVSAPNENWVVCDDTGVRIRVVSLDTGIRAEDYRLSVQVENTTDKDILINFDTMTIGDKSADPVQFEVTSKTTSTSSVKFVTGAVALDDLPAFTLTINVGYSVVSKEDSHLVTSGVTDISIPKNTVRS